LIALPPWYAKVPKDLIANRCWRIDVAKEAIGSRRARDYLKAACTDDILFYFNAVFVTYDPRLPDGEKLLPFITFPFQDDAILTIEASIQKGRDLVIYKSRDLGVSWLCLGVFEKLWHFHRDQTFLCIARDKDEVDSPAYPDALFPKIDRIHQNTPAWLMPEGWTPRRDRLKYTFNNPEMGSTINGEATVDAAGVGGRRTAILLDEFSRIEQAAELDFGTADVTNCRIFNFTAHSHGVYAFGLTQDEHKQKLMLHWSMDPRKNRKLYRWDGQTQRMQYFRYEQGAGEAVKCGDVVLKLVRCEPHEYGPEDADSVNFRSDNGYPEGKPFEPIRDGVLRSPVYDIEDRRRKNRLYMARNWDIDFKGADDRFFSLDMLMEYEREVCRVPTWEGEIECDQTTGQFLGLREKTNGPLRLWFNPDDGWPTSDKGFVAGVDLSYGKGASNSCSSFAEIDSGRKVVEYVTPHEPPEVFAAKTVALCEVLRSYGGMPAFLAWERVGPGEDFGKTVVELGYFNVYYDGATPGQEIKPGRIPGWTPNRNSIRALLGEYDVALRTRRFLNRSSPAVQECACYVETPNGVEYQVAGGRGAQAAAGGKMDVSGAKEAHGDRVRADALCNRALKLMGGGAVGDLAKKEAEKSTAPKPWTLEGRRQIHRAMQRESESYWG
jgi:hypothetical protein